MAQTAESDSIPRIEALERASYDAIVYQGQTLHGLQNLFKLWNKARFDSPYVRVRRDNDLVAAHFPEPDIDVISPAFIWPETVPAGFHTGKKGPTTASTLNRFVKSIVDRNEWIRHCDTGTTSEEGRRTTCLALSNSGRSNENGGYKLRVWLQGGVHGNEPAGDQSLLALIGKMDDDPTWTFSVLEKMDIWLIPRYNLDGVSDFRRTYSPDLDLNRDYIKTTAQQTKDMRYLFHKVAPHIVVDMHEFGAAAKFKSYVHGSDVMLSAAKNLNIHPGIRQLSEDLFVAGIARTLEQSRFRWAPYVPGTGNEISFNEAGSAASIGRNAMGLTQRTSSALRCLESVLQIATDNIDVIRATMQTCLHDFVHAQDDIIIRDMPSPVSRVFPMVDTETGELTDLTAEFESMSPSIATMTRARPEAYLVPAYMADVMDRLVKSGLQVHNLVEKSFSQVEVLTIVEAEFEETYHEGVVPMNVLTTAARRNVHVPAGSWLVSTRQKNAALAFIALEPENADSYVRLNLIPITAGEEYPIYRLMASF